MKARKQKRVSSKLMTFLGWGIRHLQGQQFLLVLSYLFFCTSSGLPSRFTQNILVFEMILQKKWMNPLFFFDLVAFPSVWRQSESDWDLVTRHDGLMTKSRAYLFQEVFSCCFGPGWCPLRTLDKVTWGIGGDKARSHLLIFSCTSVVPLICNFK